MSVNIRVQLKLISSETVTQLCIFTTGNEYVICSLHLFKKNCCSVSLSDTTRGANGMAFVVKCKS